MLLPGCYAAASARDTEEEAERRKMRQIKRERTAMMKDPKGLGKVAMMQRGENPGKKQ